MLRSSTRANVLMLLASLIWGTAFIAQTASLDAIGPFFYTGLRFLLGAAVVLVVIVVRARGRLAASTEGMRAMLAPGLALGLLVAASISLQQIGLQYTTVANAGFISSLYVILVPLFGVLRGHATARRIWFGAGLALLGLYFLSVQSDYVVRAGDWYELGGAMIIAVQIVLLGSVASRHDPFKLAFLQFAVCSLVCLLAASLFEPIALAQAGRAAFTILYGGALSVGVGYTLQVVAQRAAVPAHAAVIFSMEGVFAAIAAWVLLGQDLSVRSLLGCMLVFSGLVASQLGWGAASHRLAAGMRRLGAQRKGP